MGIVHMIAVGHKASDETEFSVLADTRTRAERHQAGFEAYCAGLSIADLHDEVEQLGYWYANSAEAYAELMEVTR